MKIEVELEVQERINIKEKILNQSDLYEILPFGKTKINQLIKSGELPLVKIEAPLPYIFLSIINLLLLRHKLFLEHSYLVQLLQVF